MTKLIAKQIVADKFWILTNGSEKIGNVIASDSGYLLKINNSTTLIGSVGEMIDLIDFEKGKLPEVVDSRPSNMHNVAIDVQRKITIYTETPASKCFHAQGWFVLDKEGDIEIVENPKYLYVVRYCKFGPFDNKMAAESILMPK